ncbi:MAG: hypothetical protein MK135_14010 [Polyangiaceae bacterium]|nr:hypothetical protein [Polyangiaceae bacterium]
MVSRHFQTDQSTEVLVSKLANKRRQRGAAIFVAMAVIMLLTSLAIWSTKSANLVARASGYNRALMQAIYLSEMGVTAATSVLSIPGQATANLNLLKNSPDECRSAVGTNSLGLPECRAIDMASISDITIQSTANSLLDADSQGSLSHLPSDSSTNSLGLAGGLQGNFVVEITDPSQFLMPGDDADSTSYQRIVLTAWAEIRPDNLSAASEQDLICVPEAAAATTQVAMRAHSIVGPLQ